MIRKLTRAAEMGVSGSIRVVASKLTWWLSSVPGRIATRVTGRWITFHLRPQFARDVGTWSDLPREASAETGIVIQGPIVSENNFTVETVKLYQRLFPGVPIVVSTWIDTSPRDVSALSALGVDVLLNAKPEYGGFGNVNLQIVSSVAGLKRAKALACRWAVKTRTDQRIYSPSALGYLRCFAQSFEAPSSRGARILACGISRKYKLYHLTDMLHYGDIDTLLAYWDTPHDTRRFTDAELQRAASSFPDLARLGVCEAYLFTSFLKRQGEDLPGTLEHSWRMIAKYALVVDKESLDFFWPKYRAAWEYRDRNYRGIDVSQELTFSEWMIFRGGFVERHPDDLDRLSPTSTGLIRRDDG